MQRTYTAGVFRGNSAAGVARKRGGSLQQEHDSLGREGGESLRLDRGGTLKRRRGARASLALRAMMYLSAFVTGLLALTLAGCVLHKGLPALTTEGLFATRNTSRSQTILPSMINTAVIMALTLAIAVPIGVFAAIYLVEYSRRGSRTAKLVRLMTDTLAAVPSIVYGLFGFTFFFLTLKWGFSLLSGVVTLAVMILPLIMGTAEEALRAVPRELKYGSYGLGAGRARTVFRVILPPALPGILSGVLLSMGKILGETAAMIFTAGTDPQVAQSLFSSAATLSVRLYTLLCEGLYEEQAYGAAAVLVVLVVFLNGGAAWAAKGARRTT